MNKLAIILILLLFGVNCTNHVSHKTKQNDINFEQTKQRINDYLIIRMKVKVKEDDVFEIYYNEYLTGYYSIDNRVRLAIKGRDSFQELIFRFPERVYPLKLRFDLGMKQHETAIEISEIKFDTGGKSSTLYQEEIIERFRFNAHISVDKQTNKINRKVVENRYDPNMYSGDLTPEITNIFSED